MAVLDTAIVQFVESWKKNFLGRNEIFDRKIKVKIKESCRVEESGEISQEAHYMALIWVPLGCVCACVRVCSWVEELERGKRDKGRRGVYEIGTYQVGRLCAA